MNHPSRYRLYEVAVAATAIAGIWVVVTLVIFFLWAVVRLAAGLGFIP